MFISILSSREKAEAIAWCQTCLSPGYRLLKHGRFQAGGEEHVALMLECDVKGSDDDIWDSFTDFVADVPGHYGHNNCGDDRDRAEAAFALITGIES